MHPSVVAKFAEFTVLFEGRVPYMYKNIKSLITTGQGNLIDPMVYALQLPWKIDGRLALAQEITADWKKVKAEANPKLHHKYAAPLSRCRLDEADIDELVQEKLLENEKMLRRDFKLWDDFTADAQLAISSMALGSGFSATFKTFNRVANEYLGGYPDYAGMKAHCRINAHEELVNNPGVISRNKANYLCFDNALVVAKNDMDPGVLHWPEIALPSPRTIPAPSGDGDLQLAAVKAFGVRTDEIGDITREGKRELSGDTEPAPPPDFDSELDKVTPVDNPRSKRS